MILIPAAGEGRRFGEAGYKGPKHLIELGGKPMIDWVIENVRPLDRNGDVVVASQLTVGKTKGAMETIKRALTGYPPKADEPLVIANCDQLIDYDADWVLSGGIGHGIIFTFKSASPAHSYVETDGRGRIARIVEKPLVPPSDKAVSGVYLFANAHGIRTAIKDALAGPDLDNGGVLRPQREQYLSVAIQRMIDQDYALYAVDVPTAILGTPEDFQRFETAMTVLRGME